MADEKRDPLAERVARRRAAEEAAAKRAADETAAQAGTQPPAPAPAPVVAEKTATTEALPALAPQFPSETSGQFPTETEPAPPELADVKNAIDAGGNPLTVARQLSGILAGGVPRKELLRHVQKSDAWLSKRLALLKAPKDIQRLIEAGQLSESEYHDNRANVKAGVHGRGDTLRYQRMPIITISIEAAKALASILQNLAAKQGAAPIRLDATPNKKDLTSILNQRAGELWGALKE